VRRVVIDANVIVSFFVDRHAKQRDAADALLQKAEEGEIAAILPQFVVFEVTDVLQSQYSFGGRRLAEMIRDVVHFPGVRVIDDCPWKRIMELWPDPFPFTRRCRDRRRRHGEPIRRRRHLRPQARKARAGSRRLRLLVMRSHAPLPPACSMLVTL